MTPVATSSTETRSSPSAWLTQGHGVRSSMPKSTVSKMNLSGQGSARRVTEYASEHSEATSNGRQCG